MTPSEFFSSLREAQALAAKHHVLSTKLSLCLGGTGVVVRLSEQWHRLNHGVLPLCELAQIPQAYATALISRNSLALLCSNLLEGLMRREEALTFVSIPCADGPAVALSRPGALLNRVEVFSAAEAVADQFGFEPLLFRAGPAGAMAIWQLPKQSLSLGGWAGALHPAIKVEYSILHDRPYVPVITHGFVKAGEPRLLGAQLVGERKFKSLRVANKVYGDTKTRVEAGVEAQRDELGPMFAAAFSFDNMMFHQEMLQHAFQRVYTGAGQELLQRLMGQEFTPAHAERSVAQLESKTQLGLALAACDVEGGTTAAGYNILTMTEAEWAKVAGKKAAAAAAT